MHLRERVVERQQAIARHHEEDARLTEEHDEDDRRQREECRQADELRHLVPTEQIEHVREGLTTASDLLRVLRQLASDREFLRARREHTSGRIGDRLRTD